MRHILILEAILATSTCVVCAGTNKCPTTRDVWLSAYSSERDFNMGAAKTIKLKTYEEFGIVDFDVSAVKGKRITEALAIRPRVRHDAVGQDALQRGYPLSLGFDSQSRLG